jgi:hypothetical protein
MLTIDSNLRKYFKNHIYPLPIIMISVFFLTSDIKRVTLSLVRYESRVFLVYLGLIL